MVVSIQREKKQHPEYWPVLNLILEQTKIPT